MVASSQVYITFQNKRFTIPQFLAFRQRVGTLRGKVASKSLTKTLSNSYKFYSDAVDLLIAKSVGASQIGAVSGRGFQADFIDIDGLSEAKTITTRISDTGEISANKITLGSINVRNIRDIAQDGVVRLPSGQLRQATEEFALSGKGQDRFANRLIGLPRSARKKWLNDTSKRNTPYGRAARQIINNIQAKAGKIYVSTPTLIGGAQIRQIGWTWQDILSNPQANIVSKGKDSIDVEFNEQLVTKVLNETTQTKEFINLNNDLVKEIEKILNQGLFTEQTFQELAKIDFDFKKLISWESGSIRVYTTKIKEGSRKDSNLKVISDAQLTALVQRETERRMPHGPARGKPLSSTVLTYRSGQFVDSIKVIQDYRTRLITYYYAPNYKVHEKRGARAPRILLQGSIRDTVRAVYGERFRIVRGF